MGGVNKDSQSPAKAKCCNGDGDQPAYAGKCS
ncbi:hypothetical protein NK6_5289 [Bradyrhizobium diazoefficiens]|uniref:Uncharacterized protein n=1 Tax=Bradyrhizobium diazoefficiens TaxID=1355477 RepID=A0A0E4BRN1_9BRAD|nr:hypothetical protein NK6_5289 [Bradyrhizobium diazoefficiens]